MYRILNEIKVYLTQTKNIRHVPRVPWAPGMKEKVDKIAVPFTSTIEKFIYFTPVTNIWE